MRGDCSVWLLVRRIRDRHSTTMPEIELGDRFFDVGSGRRANWSPRPSALLHQGVFELHLFEAAQVGPLFALDPVASQRHVC